ncbi:hypothetical protein KAFR_0H01430 [Kazachstania africana CBS 2517]|uniref:Elongin-C n=1 Tax=Kazachstania africana (strain ATCC 22294 / BCRC 22015 / CBS 2517 / CECT 1963 / NBRC 1671 / NRRL Y-8276) TaxID=1071382 RepID=H2AYZ7_KAZAF|nr:hypothetical protein KAFR_0H01430 [Kazachstania africana CBS 2517]CCF59553.1 hypothetical protein KAFR_0H01430 [Kazachstania africana CBS 2517]
MSDTDGLVNLVASDGSEHTISIEAALLSPTLKTMLEGPFKKDGSKIELTNFEPHVVQKAAEYLQHKLKYQDVDVKKEDVPEFVVPTEMSLELLLIADYLNI